MVDCVLNNYKIFEGESLIYTIPPFDVTRELHIRTISVSTTSTGSIGIKYHDQAEEFFTVTEGDVIKLTKETKTNIWLYRDVIEIHVDSISMFATMGNFMIFTGCFDTHTYPTWRDGPCYQIFKVHLRY